MSLGKEEIERYSRQLIVPRWSSGLQERLRETAILVDASLSSLAMYAVAMGIGRVVLQPDVAESHSASLDPLFLHMRRLNPSCDIRVIGSDPPRLLPQTFACVFSTKTLSDSTSSITAPHPYDSAFSAFVSVGETAHLEFYRGDDLLLRQDLPHLEVLPTIDLAGPLALMGFLEVSGLDR